MRRLAGKPGPRWKVAVMAFRDHPGTQFLVKTFKARPFGRRVLYSLDQDPSHPEVFEARMGRHRVGVVGYCDWGGPMAAILVEELAALGVKYIIGYGACGALAHDLARGVQVVADRALPTDGTSRAYCRGSCRADPGLLNMVKRSAREMGIPLRAVTVATVDALYRETKPAMNRLRRMGAEVINLENTPLYSASRACGIRTVWIGHVSDRLVTDDWEHWHGNSDEISLTSARLCRAVVTAILRRA
jgi:uridine phosphorylase